MKSKIMLSQKRSWKCIAIEESGVPEISVRDWLHNPGPLDYKKIA